MVCPSGLSRRVERGGSGEGARRWGRAGLVGYFCWPDLSRTEGSCWLPRRPFSGFHGDWACFDAQLEVSMETSNRCREGVPPQGSNTLCAAAHRTQSPREFVGISQGRDLADLSRTAAFDASVHGRRGVAAASGRAHVRAKTRFRRAGIAATANELAARSIVAPAFAAFGAGLTGAARTPSPAPGCLKKLADPWRETVWMLIHYGPRIRAPQALR